MVRAGSLRAVKLVRRSTRLLLFCVINGCWWQRLALTCNVSPFLSFRCKEVMAGVASFCTASFILAVNPVLLGKPDALNISPKDVMIATATYVLEHVPPLLSFSKRSPSLLSLCSSPHQPSRHLSTHAKLHFHSFPVSLFLLAPLQSRLFWWAFLRIGKFLKTML